LKKSGNPVQTSSLHGGTPPGLIAKRCQMFNLPKREKNLPNENKTYQIETKYTKRPQTTPNVNKMK
jgi:hypothetical protein